jgi:predicted S18 family serine protease
MARPLFSSPFPAMKKRLLLALPVLASLSLTAHAQFSIPNLGGLKLPTRKTTTTTTTSSGSVAGLTNNEAASGLKEALIQGISKGSDQASATDGFNLNKLIRIPFPPDAQKMANTLRSIGLGSQVDKFELSLNRGAEDAAKSAKPIFISAIKSLTFTDVWNILTGQKDAATQYLKRTTTSQLTTAFMPIMQQSLDKVDATKYYTSLSTTYNKLPLVTPVQTNLNQYATGKAIEGLFTLIAQEEADIRENPVARTTSLLKKVFSSIGK